MAMRKAAAGWEGAFFLIIKLEVSNIILHYLSKERTGLNNVSIQKKKYRTFLLCRKDYGAVYLSERGNDAGKQTIPVIAGFPLWKGGIFLPVLESGVMEAAPAGMVRDVKSLNRMVSNLCGFIRPCYLHAAAKTGAMIYNENDESILGLMRPMEKNTPARHRPQKIMSVVCILAINALPVSGLTAWSPM